MEHRQNTTPFRFNRIQHAMLAVGMFTAPCPLLAAQENQETMVVTASQTQHSELTAPASVSVITRAELDKLVLNDVADAVKKLPGIYINPTSSYGRSEIKIRGMKSDYTLLLVNGRRINSRETLTSGYANDFDLATIPTAAIDRIEVIRGPMSSLYGADALGGVINVILRQPTDRSEGSIGYDLDAPTVGSGGATHRLNAYGSGPLMDNRLLGNLIVDGSRRSAWHSEQSVNPNADAYEEREKLSVLGTLKWLIANSQDLDFDLVYNRDNRDANWNNAGGIPATPRNVQKMDRLNLGLTHNGSWEFFDTRARYYFERANLADDSELNKAVYDVTQTNHTVDGQVSGYLGDHLLTGGAEYRLTELRHSHNLRSGSKNVSQGAVYAQDEFSLGDLALTFGARVDEHETYGTELSPRAYATYSLSDKWVIKGGVTRAFKAPTLYQTSESYRITSCRGNCVIVGNPHLKPETSLSYELGTAYQGDRYGGGVTLFDNEIKDMIQTELWDRKVANAVLTYRNVNKARIRGIELNAWLDVTETVNLTGNWTFVDAQDRTTKRELTLTPKHTVNTQLNWQARENLSTYISYQYIGTQYLRDRIKGDAYSTVDIGASYSPVKNLALKLGMTNLTNSKRDDVAADKYDYILKGRSLYSGVSYAF